MQKKQSPLGIHKRQSPLGIQKKQSPLGIQKRQSPLGVPPDLKSGVKKGPNLFKICGFEIRSKLG